MDDYSSNKAYWHRRRPVEVFFEHVSRNIPNFETLVSELRALNERIIEKNDTIRFKCVYLFRKDQSLFNDNGDRGGYIDTWYRSSQFNMQIMNDDYEYEDHPPMPNEPVEVILGPGMQTQWFCGEFTECWHPDCLQYYRENPIKRSPVIYMLCRDHADIKTIDIIQEHVMNGKVIEDYSVKAMVDDVRRIIETRVSKTLTEAIKRAKEILEEEETPDKVIEVQCYVYEHEDDDPKEATYYVDLVKCERYLRHQDRDQDE